MSIQYSSLEKTPPPSKKKGRVKRVVNTAEYKKLVKKILDGKFAVGEEEVTHLHPEDDGEKFGSKDPARALALAIKAFLKKNNLRAEYEVKQYEPAVGREGESVVKVTYTIPENT